MRQNVAERKGCESSARPPWLFSRSATNAGKICETSNRLKDAFHVLVCRAWNRSAVTPLVYNSRRFR